MWIVLYSVSSPSTHTGSFFGNAIADWTGVVVMVIATKYLYEKGSSESRRPPHDFLSPIRERLRDHSLSLFLLITGAGWIALYVKMDSEAKWGQVVGNIEFGPVNILASSNRYITNSDENGSEPKLIWNEKFLLGIYKAEVNVALTDKGPLLKDSITFFAFPLELVLGIIVVIVLVTGLIRRARSKTEDES